LSSNKYSFFLFGSIFLFVFNRGLASVGRSMDYRGKISQAVSDNVGRWLSEGRPGTAQAGMHQDEAVDGVGQSGSRSR
jgi:hypothetical protein